MKTLVTGGTGFVGNNLARRLVELGHEVVITGTKLENSPVGDLHEIGLFGVSERCMEGVDVLFHQAANNDTLDNNCREMFRANVDHPVRLFKEAYDRGCRKFVYASSTAVYGDAPVPYIESSSILEPTNAYGLSKLCFEGEMDKFVGERDVTVVGLRYCNIYGPGESHKGRRMSLVGQCIQRALSGLPMSLFPSGEQRRDLIYISDVVDANIAASEVEKQGHFVVNVGTGISISANEIVEMISKHINAEIQIEYREKPPESFQEHTCCDIAYASRLLDWSPRVECFQGIGRYIESMKKAG